MLFFGLLAEVLAIWLWWPLLVLLLCFNSYGVTKNAAKEEFSYCTLYTLFILSVLHLFGVVDVVSFVTNHPQELTIGLLVYAAAGFPWSYFYEWPRYLRKTYKGRTERIKIVEEKLSGPENFNLVSYKDELEELKSPILASENKGRIIGWMLWWPAQLLYSAIFRWIHDFWEYVFDKFINLFQGKSQKLRDELLGNG